MKLERLKTKDKEKREVDRIAYHEAGHAVMRCFEFLKFSYVSITPDGDNAGYVKYHRSVWKNFDPETVARTDLKTIDRIENEIVSILAGPIAEKIFGGKYNWEGSEGDRASALKLASYLCGNEKVLNAYWKYMWIRTEESLKALHIWTAVQRLASELLLKKKIRYNEAKEIVFRLPGERR